MVVAGRGREGGRRSPPLAGRSNRRTGVVSYRWWRLRVVVPAQLEETAGWAMVAAGASGVEVDGDAAPGRSDPGCGAREGFEGLPGNGGAGVVLTGYFSRLAAARRAMRRLGALVSGFSDVGAFRAEGVAQGALSATLQAQTFCPRTWLSARLGAFAPVRVGALEIRPLRHPQAGRGPASKPADGAARLAIYPGMAFGTGHHPTTQQALWALQHALRRAGPAPRVVDVGTGSGILAIAAARLGAAQVLAVDVDPVALREAARNVRHNRVVQQVRLALGSWEQAERLWGSGCADVVVANLVAPELVRLALPLAALVRPQGMLIGAGVAAAQALEVAAAWQGAGLCVELWGLWGEWAWVEALRPA